MSKKRKQKTEIKQKNGYKKNVQAQDSEERR